MQALALQTTIGTGKDKQIEVLFNGLGRKIIQITLRNNGVLEAHKAGAPITIQCVAGSGALLGDEATSPISLTPGILVTLEPNIVHSVKGLPAVSILVSQFINHV